MNLLTKELIRAGATQYAGGRFVLVSNGRVHPFRKLFSVRERFDVQCAPALSRRLEASFDLKSMPFMTIE
jgi:hypothetical protein